MKEVMNKGPKIRNAQVYVISVRKRFSSNAFRKGPEIRKVRDVDQGLGVRVEIEMSLANCKED